ncbi:hypothetical protein EB796_003809 [Bugula neritina]|uniref:TTC28 n=1 Tax=Bugula neritina TaxID=10212 RepID=A0A7J7KKL1_BUGNE|nr:hypothetical protein EB796_003809 [Bugula neritina]
MSWVMCITTWVNTARHWNTTQNIATSCKHIGVVYHKMGEYGKALEYQKKSLNMKLAVYGTEARHASIAASYNTIGLVYDNMGEYGKALEYHTKSLEMYLAVYGTEATHADIAASYNNIVAVKGRSEDL